MLIPYIMFVVIIIIIIVHIPNVHLGIIKVLFIHQLLH
jgi:hypothetical protein